MRCRPVGKAHARLLKKLASEIAAIETAIGRKDQCNAGLRRPRRDHPERAGFAEATALTLLAGLPELGQVSK